MLYQKVFFLECIGRGGVGQIMTKADEGGGGVKQTLKMLEGSGMQCIAMLQLKNMK